MHARTILISSLTCLCMIGAGRTIALVQKPKPVAPPVAHTGQDPTTLEFGATPLTTELVVNGLSRPVQVLAAPGDFDRIFILEQRSGSTGRIRIYNLNTNSLNGTAFLSVSVSTSSEQGLLGMAFHPDYDQNGFFYINYTATNGSTVIKRYSVSGNPDIANSGSGLTLMSWSQPFTNHNGGWLGFGPDGYLYIATGDGGSANDPGNRAQDITNQRLGKMLRIDVDSGTPYGIPPSNPYVGVTGDDEIWARGLRNPWRCSFDTLTGDLWIGDVGQNAWEEITFQPAASTGGENYGWRCYEANHAFNTSGCPSAGTMVFPIWEYSHGSGCSVTGGHVYRGSAIPSLQGTYFFADYCFGTIWSFKYDGATVTDFQNRTAELDPPGALSIGLISAFGRDAAGEIYICDLNGEVFRIIAEAASGACCVGDEGACVNITESNCNTGGGTWLGAETTCAEGGCEPDPCIGDVNGSGNVDISDLLSVIGAWGPCAGCSADINDDDVVNVTDLLAIIAAWGACP